MSSSKVLVYFCFSFVLGIISASFFSLSFTFFLFFLFLGIFCSAAFFKSKMILILDLCLLFFSFGIWRYQNFLFKIENTPLANLTDQEIELKGIVIEEPAVGEKISKLIIRSEEGSKILITTAKYPTFHYGDKLKITGKIKRILNTEKFPYENYFKKERILFVFYFPKIELIDKNQDNFLLARILLIKEKLRNSIEENFSFPNNLILAALILGDKERIPADWKTKLNLAGVRHIVAISGLHVMVLSNIIMAFLIGLGFWRRQALYISLIFLLLFIILTGFQPSAIRAGIMGSLLIIAQAFGRTANGFRSLIFALTLMLLQNPLLLKFDLGFQLSFLATLGIIFFNSDLKERLNFIPEENFLNLRSILATTFSAQILTLPILIYNFGYFSLASPFTNFLIVPFLPIIMGLGFIASFLGIFFPFLSRFFSIPSEILLTFLRKIVEFFSQLSFSVFYLKISWWWLIISYLLLTFLIWRIKEKEKLKFLRY